jgi:uncharacterized protein
MQIDLYAVFLIGLFGGFSHCIGMCGGFVMTYTLKLSQNAVKTKPKFWAQVFPHLLYNSGRILTYVLLGEVFGILGMTLGSALAFKSFQGGLMIFAGIVMVFMGLDLAGFVPSLPKDSFLGSNKFKSLVQSLLDRVHPNNIFGLGIVMGFLPCGMVYAVGAKAAATQSIWQGGLTMLVFGLGTFPAMVLTGITAHLISVRLRSTLYRIAAILVIVLGIFTVSKGLQKLGGAGPMNHHHQQIQMDKQHQ